MTLTSRPIGNVTVLAADGELTVPTAPAFLRRARLLLAPTSVPLVVVDLARVRRADASGFAALVALLRHVQRRQGDVCLAGLAPPVRLMLEIMQLHLLFEVCETVEAAVAGLGAARAAAAAPEVPRHLLGRIRGSITPVPRRIAS
jgi:anti-anti-sigma factor